MCLTILWDWYLKGSRIQVKSKLTLYFRMNAKKHADHTNKSK